MKISPKYHYLTGTHCWYCDREYEKSKCVFLYSGQPLRRTKDHIVPICQDGANRLRNKIGACSDCNTLKGGKTLKQLAVWITSMIKTKTPHSMSKLFKTIENRCWKIYNKTSESRLRKSKCSR